MSDSSGYIAVSLARHVKAIYMCVVAQHGFLVCAARRKRRDEAAALKGARLFLAICFCSFAGGDAGLTTPFRRGYSAPQGI